MRLYSMQSAAADQKQNGKGGHGEVDLFTKITQLFFAKEYLEIVNFFRNSSRLVFKVEWGFLHLAALLALETPPDKEIVVVISAMREAISEKNFINQKIKVYLDCLDYLLYIKANGAAQKKLKQLKNLWPEKYILDFDNLDKVSPLHLIQTAIADIFMAKDFSLQLRWVEEPSKYLLIGKYIKLQIVLGWGKNDKNLWYDSALKEAKDLAAGKGLGWKDFKKLVDLDQQLTSQKEGAEFVLAILKPDNEAVTVAAEVKAPTLMAVAKPPAIMEKSKAAGELEVAKAIAEAADAKASAMEKRIKALEEKNRALELEVKKEKKERAEEKEALRKEKEAANAAIKKQSSEESAATKKVKELSISLKTEKTKRTAAEEALRAAEEKSAAEAKAASSATEALDQQLKALTAKMKEAEEKLRESTTIAQTEKAKREALERKLEEEITAKTQSEAHAKTAVELEAKMKLQFVEAVAQTQKALNIAQQAVLEKREAEETVIKVSRGREVSEKDAKQQKEKFEAEFKARVDAEKKVQELQTKLAEVSKAHADAIEDIKKLGAAVSADKTRLESQIKKLKDNLDAAFKGRSHAEEEAKQLEARVQELNRTLGDFKLKESLLQTAESELQTRDERLKLLEVDLTLITAEHETVLKELLALKEKDKVAQEAKAITAESNKAQEDAKAIHEKIVAHFSEVHSAILGLIRDLCRGGYDMNFVEYFGRMQEFITKQMKDPDAALQLPNYAAEYKACLDQINTQLVREMQQQSQQHQQQPPSYATDGLDLKHSLAPVAYQPPAAQVSHTISPPIASASIIAPRAPMPVGSAAPTAPHPPMLSSAPMMLMSAPRAPIPAPLPPLVTSTGQPLMTNGAMPQRLLFFSPAQSPSQIPIGSVVYLPTAAPMPPQPPVPFMYVPQ